jgi:hypothetical protein
MATPQAQRELTPDERQSLEEWIEDFNRRPEQFVRIALPDAAGNIRVEMEVLDALGWFASCLLVKRGDDLIAADFRVFPGTLERRHIAATPVGEWDPADPVPGVGATARVLRKVSLAQLVERGANAIYTATRSGRLEPGPLAVAKPTLRTGRGGTPDLEYLPYAQRYDAKKALPIPSSKPLVEIADDLGNGFKRETVRDLIHKCRSRGLLTPSGRLTDYALALAAGEVEDRRGRS